MKNTLTFFILIIVSSYTLAQSNNFSVRIDDKGDAEETNQIIKYNNGLLVGSFSNCITNSKKTICHKIFKLDEKGNVTAKRTFRYAPLAGRNCMIVKKDTLIYLGSNIDTASYGQRFRIYKMLVKENSFDIIDSSFTVKGVDYQYDSGIKVYDENHLIFMLYAGANEAKSLELYKITNEGKIVWKKKVSKDFEPDTYGEFIIDNENNIVVSFRGWTKGQGWLDSRGFVIKLDKDGNRLFSKDMLDISKSYDLNALSLLDKDTYLFATNGSEKIPKGSSDSTKSPPMIVAIKKNGDMLWKRYVFINFKTSYSEISHVEVIENGDIIGVGTQEDKQKMPLRGGWIFCLDNKGQTKWDRTIRDERGLSKKAFTAGELLTVTSSNGIIYAGGMYMDTFPNYKPSINNNNAWVISLDQNGCFTPNCDNKQFIVSAKEEALVTEVEKIKIFPTLATDVIHVLNIDNFNEDKDLSYQIIDTQGNQITQGIPDNNISNLDISLPSSLPNATYFLRIKSSKMDKTFKFIKIQ